MQRKSKTTPDDDLVDRKNEEIKKSNSNSLISSYTTLLAKYPFIVNNVQGGIIVLLSNVVFGHLNKTAIDWNDAFLWIVLNLVFITPMLLFFYAFLERQTTWQPWMKVAFDQFIWSPFFTASLLVLKATVEFLLPMKQPIHTWSLQEILAQTSASGGLLGGEILNKVIPGVVELLPKILMSNYLFWIPVRLVSINFIPTQFHLLSGR